MRQNLQTATQSLGKLTVRKACLVVFVLTILTGTAGAQSSNPCPSPSPTCASTGTVTISGSYSCTGVGLDGNGYPKVNLVIVSFTSNGGGVGTVSVIEAQNTNDPNSSPSYKDFASQGTLNYCISADNTTGYINPGSTTSGNCPLAVAFTSADGVADAQFRAIDTTENNVSATVCRAQ